MAQAATASNRVPAAAFARLTPVRTVLLFLLATQNSATVQAPSSSRAIRIPVRHADPWAIKAMMEGRPIVSPEISTLLMGMGQMGAAGAAAAASNLLMGGTLFVNPTDNSLWWVPGKG